MSQSDLVTVTPPLTDREHQVLEQLAAGATYQAIARRLNLSPHTVDTYLRRIRSKTGAVNRTQLALLAFSLGHRPTTD
ncbi:helix-turn-helix transcriptional regulator [Kitasatospora sp. NPDC004669]|uniref:response regulator transcription factor n=1 Tax=Kitasatospora sp. NPDC004669 TaxID=3154555 RepID=UPI0033A499BD